MGQSRNNQILQLTQKLKDKEQIMMHLMLELSGAIAELNEQRLLNKKLTSFIERLSNVASFTRTKKRKLSELELVED